MSPALPSSGSAPEDGVSSLIAEIADRITPALEHALVSAHVYVSRAQLEQLAGVLAAELHRDLGLV